MADCKHTHVSMSEEDAVAGKAAFIAYLKEGDTNFYWSDEEIEEAANALRHGKCIACGEYTARPLVNPNSN